MKSILLLAAVYSLIIHQWHKEKGVQQEKKPVKEAVQAQANMDKEQANHTSAFQFLALYSRMIKD